MSSRPTLAAVLDHYGLQYVQRHGWVSVMCPFHDESVASLRVNVDEGGFICLACGTKGSDAMDFIRAKEGCDFVTALDIADGIPGERIESKPTKVDGRPAPVDTKAYTPRYRRMRRR